MDALSGEIKSLQFTFIVNKENTHLNLNVSLISFTREALRHVAGHC